MTAGRLAGIPLTVGDLLLDPPPAAGVTGSAGSEGHEAIRRLLREHPTLGRLTPRAGGAIGLELERLLREALADRLVDLLFDQVSGYHRLAPARRATAANPRSVERVTLMQFGWRIDYAPGVSVQLDGAPLLTVEVRVELIFRTDGLAAVVRDGRLIELHAAALGIEGRLWLQSVPVSQRSMSLPMALILGTAEGLPLAPYPPSPKAVPGPGRSAARVPAGPSPAIDDDLPVVHFTD